jgi:hypothetical protein
MRMIREVEGSGGEEWGVFPALLIDTVNSGSQYFIGIKVKPHEIKMFQTYRTNEGWAP